ncbi:MAG: methyltransferase domain-containing protein [Nitrososphaera sp.]
MRSSYVLGNLAREIERLEIQASLFAPLSHQALLKAGIREGMCCIDIGCGSGSVTRMIADIVGKSGQVVGVDIDEQYLKYCRSVSDQHNIEFVRDDISKSRLDERESFDIVFSRFLFVHLKDRKSAVRTMKRLLKAGGSMVIQELDHAPGSWLCYPEDRNVEALRKLYVALLKISGGDPLAGRKLYRLLVEESLNADVECYSPCLRMGHEPHSSLGWRIMQSLRPQLLGAGLLDKKRYADLYKGLKELSRKKDAFVTYARFFSAIGRK